MSSLSESLHFIPLRLFPRLGPELESRSLWGFEFENVRFGVMVSLGLTPLFWKLSVSERLLSNFQETSALSPQDK